MGKKDFKWKLGRIFYDLAEGKIGVLDAYERYDAIENEKLVLQKADVSGSLPTLQEIKTSLYKCAKVTIESDGVKMERLFEKEAKAMLALFGGNDL